MKMKANAKFEEEWTCQFEIGMRNLTNFDSSAQKSKKKCTLMDCFWPKYIIFGLKKNRWHW